MFVPRGKHFASDGVERIQGNPSSGWSALPAADAARGQFLEGQLGEKGTDLGELLAQRAAAVPVRPDLSVPRRAAARRVRGGRAPVALRPPFRLTRHSLRGDEQADPRRVVLTATGDLDQQLRAELLAARLRR